MQPSQARVCANACDAVIKAEVAAKTKLSLEIVVMGFPPFGLMPSELYYKVWIDRSLKNVVTSQRIGRNNKVYRSSAEMRTDFPANTPSILDFSV